MSTSNFYRAFEDLHRGSRELIQSRQTVYLPFAQAAARLHPDAPLTDLGCGRGEWLELLTRHGLAAQGVDLDEGMLEACRERGLKVERGDAIEFLHRLPPDSQAVVSAFHVAEHLPFDVLQELVSQSLRVLRPGGLLILETPNPENIAVGTSGFYMDPTHERPLPPDLLAFVPQFAGFARVKTLRLNEGVSLHTRAPVNLADVLAGASPDYAVIALKQIAPQAPDHPAVAEMDRAFAQDHGVTTLELAQRYEQQWNGRLHHSQLVAEASRSAALAAQASATEALGRVTAVHQQILTEMGALTRQLAQQLAQSREEVRVIRQSRSWRITRPLRWAAEQRRALREQGAGERARKLVGKGTRVSLRMAARAARLAGMHDFAARMQARLTVEIVVEPDVTPLTPAAKRIRFALERAMARHSAVVAERKE